MIRAFELQDKDVLLSIWRETSAFAHPFLTSEVTEMVHTMIRDTLLDIANTWMLDHDGTSVGFLSLLGNEVGGLFVRPQFHGRGYGRALMDHAVGLHGPVELEVFRLNAVGRRFYDRYGFVAISERFDDMTGQDVIRLRFEPA